MTADARDLFRTLLVLLCMLVVSSCLLLGVDYFRTGLANLACLLSLINYVVFSEEYSP